MKRVIMITLAMALLIVFMAGCTEKSAGSSAVGESIPVTTEAAVPTTEAATIPTEPEKTVPVHVHVPESWGNVSVWAWSEDRGDLFDTWPGGAMKLEGEGWYGYDVPEWVKHLIISGLGGSVKTENIDIEPKEIWIALEEDGTFRMEYEAFEIPKDGYIAVLKGRGAMLNRNGGNFPALISEEPVKDCYQLTVTLDITMKAGARCKEWQLLGITGETDLTVEILGDIYLPDGDGKVTQTLRFDDPVSFEALCIEPKVLGGYSWNQKVEYTDIWTLPQE